MGFKFLSYEKTVGCYFLNFFFVNPFSFVTSKIPITYMLDCLNISQRLWCSYLFFNMYFLLLFKYSFLPFPPTLAQHSSPSHFPHISNPHPVNCPCVLYNYSCKPFTLFPWNSLPSPFWSLSACSQFQCLWFYFACLFVLLIRFLLKVRSYGMSFTAWLISLSIMFSSSIHAVAKCRTSFFLSAA